MVIIDRTNAQAWQMKGLVKMLSVIFCFVPYHQEVIMAIIIKCNNSVIMAIITVL